jgi:hypothetical protein
MEHHDDGKLNTIVTSVGRNYMRKLSECCRLIVPYLLVARSGQTTGRGSFQLVRDETHLSNNAAGVRSPAGVRCLYFHLSVASRPALRSTQPPIRRGSFSGGGHTYEGGTNMDAARGK